MTGGMKEGREGNFAIRDLSKDSNIEALMGEGQLGIKGGWH